MKKKALRSVILLFISANVLLTPGCTLLLIGGAAAGAVAGTAFIMGKLTGKVSNSMEQVKTATIAAFGELNIKQTNIKEIAESITIVGEDSTNQGVRVVITPEENKGSKIEIRFGTFGDKDKSNKLYNKIIQNLGNVSTDTKS